MSWWMLAGGTMALICAAGHAIAGYGMFYLPIKADLRSELHAGVFAGMPTKAAAWWARRATARLCPPYKTLCRCRPSLAGSNCPRSVAVVAEDIRAYARVT
jgi:hypothetical protein